MRGPGRQEGQRHTDPDTRTEDKGRDGRGTDGEGSVRGARGREGSVGTPRTPIPTAAAKGLISPGDTVSCPAPALRTGRLCSSRFWVSLGWSRARQRVQAW